MLQRHASGQGRRRCLNAVVLALAAASVGICFPSAGAVPPVSPPVFSNPLNITNPLFPFVPGGVKLFTGVSDRQPLAIVDLYLQGTRTFQANGVAVATRILQETEFENGALIEISRNFFAQADDGTVYYFGEVVDIYEGGSVVSHEGSWLVGGASEPGDPPDAGNATAPAGSEVRIVVGVADGGETTIPDVGD